MHKNSMPCVSGEVHCSSVPQPLGLGLRSGNGQQPRLGVEQSSFQRPPPPNRKLVCICLFFN